MAEVSELSRATQDYLKVIWTAAEWTAAPVTTTMIAERLGLRTSTVSDAIRKLAETGLVTHERYGNVSLTEVGRTHAVSMVRRHRLLETFLVEVLGYTWDEVHNEAEELEHAVSETLVNRIDTHLGHPQRDPHGDPIPSADGTSHLPEAMSLDQCQPGEPRVVIRLSDADPELLRFFAERGLLLDAIVEVLPVEPYIPGITVRIQSGATVTLAVDAAAAIWTARP